MYYYIDNIKNTLLNLYPRHECINWYMAYSGLHSNNDVDDNDNDSDYKKLELELKSFFAKSGRFRHGFENLRNELNGGGGFLSIAC